MRAVGSHWEWADELREGSPVYFNTFAQGYWIFTRHDAVRDIYKTPEIFSSESFTPWEPEPIYRFVPTQIDRAGPHQVPADPEPVVLAAGDGRGGADDARAVPASWSSRPRSAGSCNFVNEFALRFPTEAFLAVIGVDTGRRRHVRALGRGLLRRLRRRRGQARSRWRRRSKASASTGSTRWPSARAKPEPREGDLASYLMHASFDDRPLTDNEILDMLTVLVLAGLDTTRGGARLHVPAPRDASRASAGADRRSGS